ncbi:MAG: glycosyltransferase family 4 protein [Bacteroidetes bacterium]|nr:glycosyltransferase family 4 protein [Bacteroidota bacterium]
MKIAIVINTTWNIFNFRMGLLEALQSDGHEIHAISPADEYVTHLVDTGIIHHHVSISAHGSNPIKDCALLMDLMRLYIKIKPDVILHYTIKPNIYGSLAAAILKIPVVNNVSGLGSAFHRKTITYYMVQLLYKLAFINADKIFFQNNEDRNFFVQKKLVRSAKTDLLPGSGINLRKFHPVHYQKGSPFVFLMVARLISDKGIFEYVEAIRHLRSKGYQAKFQLLGAFDAKPDRAVKPEMIDAWEKEGLLEYLGVTDHVQEIMSQSHCVVLPSYREGTPRVLLEAGSLCKPIVATDVAGCHHVVKDGCNGFLCKPMDSIDLANKMQLILESPEEQLRKMGENGRQLIETTFDENRVIDKYRQAIFQFDIPLPFSLQKRVQSLTDTITVG